MKKKKPPILWTLFRLWRAWRRYPMLRLGQLISSAIDGRDVVLFYVKDEALVQFMDEKTQ